MRDMNRPRVHRWDADSSAKNMPTARKGRAPKTEVQFDSSVPWLETQAQVTDCHYEFARMNTLTLGIAPDSYRFRISFTYYAHAKTFSGEFTSPVAMLKGGPFPVFYNPLKPQENRRTESGAGSGLTDRNPLFAIGIAGSVVISLLYLAMMQSCN
jgi:hypothetical protein